MNNNSLSSLIDNRISILNKYGLDDKSIKEFRSKIKEQYKVKCTSCWLVYIKNGK